MSMVEKNGVIESPKVIIKDEEVMRLTREDFLEKWRNQEKYILNLENQLQTVLGNFQKTDMGKMKENEDRLKEELQSCQRRESLLMQKLAVKDRDLHETLQQMDQLKAQNTQVMSTQLRSMMLDPAVNTLFQRLRKEMTEVKEKLEQTQNDLQAWKFTPDSQTGKRLMARIRQLHQENVELGESISSGALAKLESEIALGKTLVQEMKKTEAEHEDFLAEIDEETESLQSTICILQTQLREAQARIEELEGSSNPSLTRRPPEVPLTTTQGFLSASGYGHQRMETSCGDDSTPLHSPSNGSLSPSRQQNWGGFVTRAGN